jgi:succinyl-diaminopimelate desuccinylase
MAFFDKKEVAGLLADLVKIPSPYFEEGKIMEFAHGWLTDAGVPVDYHRFHEDRIFDYKGVNVVGALESGHPGPTVVVNGHLDTVKLCDGWTLDPFAASIDGNRMYGLGACDMKGGCAAIMMALSEFARKKRDFSGKILYSLVCDEEGPFGLGTDALILDGLIPKDADVAVIAEPSSAFSGVPFPSLCLGARGGWNYSVRVKGKSAHGAQPECGVNAVSEAAKILLELERAKLPAHKKLGPGSICCIDFHGGGAALSVPDEAVFSIFRHVTVGETKETVLREARAAIERAGVSAKAKVRFRDAPHDECDGFPAYVVPEDNPYVNGMKASMEAATGKEPAISYFSSVGDFCYTGGRLGIPTLVAGPKGGNFHGADEYVELDTVTKTAEFLYDFLSRITEKKGGF